LLWGPARLSFGVVSLPSQASIRVRAGESEWRFDWRDFDGDDCFGNFQITAVTNGQTRSYDFGPSVVSAVKKLNRFFRDGNRETVGGGFRNPDIRYYDVYRSSQNYRLAIRFEGSALHDEFQLTGPEMHLDPEFLVQYYGTTT
jgi:hypothetical protein